MLIHNFSLTTSIEHVKVDWATITEYKLELQTKVREDFKITEKALSRTISWLKVPASAFRFKNLYDTMLNRHLNEASICIIGSTNHKRQVALKIYAKTKTTSS